jgi:CRISPR system Cascade subunit CasD
LLLRLAAPIQSWGAENKFERRSTMREPTKSGVIGLLAAALGRRRHESIDDLARLHFGVRLDQPGQLLRDFHTAKGSSKKEKFVTERYYLSDAVFLVGLEGDEALLQELDEALQRPVFPLYLGRRSCPPSGKITLGLRKMGLEEALYTEPWQASAWHKKRIRKNPHLTLVIDAKQPEMLARRDLPLSFSQDHRKYALHYIENKVGEIPVTNNYNNEVVETEHDPFTGLEDEHVSVKN